MSSPSRRRLTRQQRRDRSHPKVVKAIRERKAGLPWRRACEWLHQVVDAGDLPPGCHRVGEAMARCHEEHGSGVRDRELMIGYGLRGDPKRLEARQRARGEAPRFDGIAEEAKLSRRYAIHCVQLIVNHPSSPFRKWFGGPDPDYRKNVRDDHLQRANKAGERRVHTQGVGGAGWANAYTVEGIPDPLPPDDLPPRPTEPPSAPPPTEPPAGWRRVRDAHERDRLERQRRRLADQEEARGP